jgi:hypothetical protein
MSALKKHTSPVICAAVFLVACAAVLAASGCGGTKPTTEQTIDRYSDELSQTVSETVPEQEPREHMLTIVNQMKAVHLRFSRETADFINSYHKLNADYDAPRPAFDQLFSEYNAKRIQARKEVLDLHFQLASSATAAEWEPIERAEKKLYEQVLKALPQAEGTK